MKKLILSLTAILFALTLSACMAEEYRSNDVDINMAGGRSAVDVIYEPNAASPCDVDINTDAAEPTTTDSEAPQSVEEWEEWECIAERPDEFEENAAVSPSQPAAENNAPIPADTTSGDPVNTTPANLNALLPTMTYASVNSAGEYEYTVQNNTQYEWGYGLEPYFDKYDEEQGVWLPVEPMTEITVIEIYCILPSGGSSTYTLPIDQYYGDLSAGLYRVGLLMRNHTTEMAEMVWYEFNVGIDESYWRNCVIECY